MVSKPGGKIGPDKDEEEHEGGFSGAFLRGSNLLEVGN